ncbi:PAS domain-containing protein, partial [Chloroflexota bacterium]
VLQKLISGENVDQVEVAFISKNGRVIAVEGNVNIKLANGEPAYTRGIFRDITKSKKLEEEKLRLSTALSMTIDCIIITDFDSKIVDVNKKTLKIYDVNNKNELIGRYFLTLIAPADRKRAILDVAEIMEKGYLESRKYSFVSKRGHEIPVKVNASLVRDADGNPMGMVRVAKEI